MNFSVCLCLGLCSFFLGSSIGSFFCLVFSKIFKKKHLRCRVSLFCLTLTFSIVFFSVFLNFIQKKYSLFFILNDFDSLKFLLILFGIGFFVFSFLKILLIPFVAIYISITIYTFCLINNKFSSFPKNLPISINSPETEVFAKIYKIPSKFLFPIPRFYYEIEFSDDKKENSQTKKEENANFFEKKINEFDNWLLSDFEIQKVEIPKALFYPSLHILKFKSNFDDFEILVTRTL